MNAEEIRALVKRYHQAWGQGDIDALDGTLHEDFINYDPASGDKRDREFEKEFCESWHASFSDTDLQVKQIIVEGDRVAAYWLMSATHTAGFMGIEATGNEVTIAGLETHRVQDGKFIESWRISQTMGLMQQLGAV